MQRRSIVEPYVGGRIKYKIMTREEIELKIAETLKQKKNRVVRKNVISGAMQMFFNPANALDRLFFGTEKDMGDAKLKYEQELILDLIISMNESLDDIEEKFNSRYEGEAPIIIDGLISVESESSGKTIGVDIKADSPPVEFKSGTRIEVKSNGSGDVTGLNIGRE